MDREPTIREVNAEIRKALKNISETNEMIDTLTAITPEINYILELKVILKNQQDFLLCLLKVKETLKT